MWSLSYGIYIQHTLNNKNNDEQQEFYFCF